MPDIVYRLVPDKTMQDSARVYRGETAVAYVSRHRKTKRSVWTYSLSSLSGLGQGMGFDEYLAHHAAIVAVARQWEAPNAD